MSRLWTVVLIGLCPIAAFSAPIEWGLSGVAVSTGGTATGTFVSDADTDVFSNIHVTISGGSNSFYDANYVALLPGPVFISSADEVILDTGTSGLTGTPAVLFVLNSNMSDAGGEIPVVFDDLGTCGNDTCSSIAAGLPNDNSPDGQVAAIGSTPEPSLGVLVGLGLIGLAWAKSRKRPLNADLN